MRRLALSDEHVLSITGTGYHGLSLATSRVITSSRCPIVHRRDLRICFLYINRGQCWSVGLGLGWSPYCMAQLQDLIAFATCLSCRPSPDFCLIGFPSSMFFNLSSSSSSHIGKDDIVLTHSGQHLQPTSITYRSSLAGIRNTRPRSCGTPQAPPGKWTTHPL